MSTKKQRALIMLPNAIVIIYIMAYRSYQIAYDHPPHTWMPILYALCAGSILTSSIYFIFMEDSGNIKNKALHVGDSNWVSVESSLPDNLETVWISNGKGFTTLGCIVHGEDGYHWAETNGIIYEENGKIVSECESDDLDVKIWHRLPQLPSR